MDWTPVLPDTPEPAYRRLAQSLARDVQAGRLPDGARLPTHRSLAHQLGVSIATVTRAYAEAEAQGLIASQVGRGSFVSAKAPPVSDGPVDLARNLPPLAPAERRLSAALRDLAKRPDLAEHLAYPSAGGAPSHRAAAARWMARWAAGFEPDPSRVILTAGAQQAVAVAMGAVVRPGEAVLCEAATFHGVKTLAAHMGYRLIPGAMDAEGLTPDALDRAGAQGVKAAYVQPLQNPTARLMGMGRRRDLAEIARRRSLMLIEDDLYGAFARPAAHPPLAALAPERTLYISGLSKTVAPGLRLGFLSTPPGEVFERCLEGLRAVAFGSPALGALVGEQWLQDGTAETIFEEVLGETRRRSRRALEVLGRRVEPPAVEASPHLWLPLDELTAERVAGRAARRGVSLTPPRAQVVADAPVGGLRLCLGGPRDAAELERGLQAVAWALGDEEEARDGV